MTLLDCAFCFFKNFPCRLTFSEMKFDLPCVEPVFASRHPFREPNFQYSRRVTVYDAVQNLFIEQQVSALSVSPPNRQSPQQSSSKADVSNPLSFNVLDMAILIHRRFLLAIAFQPQSNHIF
jgi:hypothetical protein